MKTITHCPLICFFSHITVGSIGDGSVDTEAQQLLGLHPLNFLDFCVGIKVSVSVYSESWWVYLELEFKLYFQDQEWTFILEIRDVLFCLPIRNWDPVKLVSQSNYKLQNFSAISVRLRFFFILECSVFFLLFYYYSIILLCFLLHCALGWLALISSRVT